MSKGIGGFGIAIGTDGDDGESIAQLWAETSA